MPLSSVSPGSSRRVGTLNSNRPKATRGHLDKLWQHFHLMVGLPCRGKTTLARNLETEHNKPRLTVGDVHVRLFGMGVDDRGGDTDFTAPNASGTNCVRTRAI